MATACSYHLGALLLTTLVLATGCGGGAGRGSGGATDGTGSTGAATGGTSAGSGSGTTTGPGTTGDAGGGQPPCTGQLTPLLERLEPSLDDIAAWSLDDMRIAGPNWPALASLDLPDFVAIHLDPSDATSRVGLCLDWGIMTSGTLRLPTPQRAADLLGQAILGPTVPARRVGYQPAAGDIYGCAPVWVNQSFPVATTEPAQTPQDVQAYLDGLPEIRLLHPYMVAYPCSDPDTRAPQVTTSRAAIFTTQFATTGDGLAWAQAFDDSGVAGDNDTQGADETWHQAWEVAARHGAMVLWLGDVSFPRRWYPAAPRTPDNPLGIVCDPAGEATGWGSANDFTGLAFFGLHVAAQAMGDAPVPDAMLATFSAVPYMRALSAGATLLTRTGEALGLAAPPDEFSVSGASKGGMGCLYATAGDPRITHGACKVFDAFDTESTGDMMHRMVTDWGLCQGGGLRADGCATGNFPGFPGPQILPYLEGSSAAFEQVRDTWSLGRLLPDLACSAPDDRVFLQNGSTDFHWSVGSNDAMWTARPPDPASVRMLYRMNADHGMSHLVPDDAPHGLGARDWTHGVQDYQTYRAFFGDHTPPTAAWTEPPRRAGDMVVGRVSVSPDVAGARLWVAASTDRDFSFCTGIEGEPGDFMCRGDFLCDPDESVAGPACPGAHLTATCPPGMANLSDAQRTRLGAAVPLPTRPAAGHYCWWRHDDGTGRDPWQQCLAPRLDPNDPLPDLGTTTAVEQFVDDSDNAAQRLARLVRGTFADVPIPDEGIPAPADPGRTPLPRTFRFRAFGAPSLEAVLDASSFVNPYDQDAGSYTRAAAGFFQPYPVEVGADGTVDVAWPIPAGTGADHFAVTVQIWRDGPEGVPDVVYAPILTVAPDPDPASLTCE